MVAILTDATVIASVSRNDVELRGQLVTHGGYLLQVFVERRGYDQMASGGEVLEKWHRVRLELL